MIFEVATPSPGIALPWPKDCWDWFHNGTSSVGDVVAEIRWMKCRKNCCVKIMIFFHLWYLLQGLCDLLGGIDYWEEEVRGL